MPFAVEDATPVTVGAVVSRIGVVVSTTKAALARSEPAAPGEAKVNVAAFKALSLIVPEFRTNAAVLM